MVKFREPEGGAAYVIAEGVDAEEAAKLGLAVVESRPDGTPMHWGKYKDAPDGGPLGVTVAKSEDTEVVAGGGVSAPAPAPTTAPQTNLDDPVVKTPPGVETIHADNAPPGKTVKELEGQAQTAPAVPEKPTDAKKGR